MFEQNNECQFIEILRERLFREARLKLLVQERKTSNVWRKKFLKGLFSDPAVELESRKNVSRSNVSRKMSKSRCFFGPGLSLYHWRQIQYNVGCENLVQALGWPRGLFCLSRVANISSCLQNQKSKNA